MKRATPFVLREYTESQREQLLRLVSDGMTKTAACEALGIPKETVTMWVVRDEEFSVKWRRARIEQVHSMADEIIEIADEPIASMEEAQRQRARITARQWVMGKWAPRLYGEKLQQDSTQRIGVILLPAVDQPGVLKQISAPPKGLGALKDG